MIPFFEIEFNCKRGQTLMDHEIVFFAQQYRILMMRLGLWLL